MNNLTHSSPLSFSLGSCKTAPADRFIRRENDVNQLAQSFFTNSPNGRYQTQLHKSLSGEDHSPRLNFRCPRSTKTAQQPKTSYLRILDAADLSPLPGVLSLTEKHTLTALKKTVCFIKNPLSEASKDPTTILFQRTANHPISLVKIIREEKKYFTCEVGGVLQITDIEDSSSFQSFDLSSSMQIAYSTAQTDRNAVALGTNNGVFLFDTRVPSSLYQLAGSASRRILCLDFSREQTYLSTGDVAGRVSIFDIRNPPYPLSEYTHATTVTSLGALSQNRYLLTADCDEEGMLKVFDISQGRTILEVPNQTGIKEFKWCDNYLFTAHAAEDSTLNMWSFDVERGLSFIQDLIPPLTSGFFSSLTVEKTSTGLLVGAANIPVLSNSSLYFLKLSKESEKTRDPDESDLR